MLNLYHSQVLGFPWSPVDYWTLDFCKSIERCVHGVTGWDSIARGFLSWTHDFWRWVSSSTPWIFLHQVCKYSLPVESQSDNHGGIDEQLRSLQDIDSFHVLVKGMLRIHVQHVKSLRYFPFLKYWNMFSCGIVVLSWGCGCGEKGSFDWSVGHWSTMAYAQGVWWPAPPSPDLHGPVAPLPGSLVSSGDQQHAPSLYVCCPPHILQILCPLNM